MFELEHVAHLAANACGLDATVLTYDEAEGAAAEADGDAVWAVVPRWLRSGGLVLVAYARAAPSAEVKPEGGNVVLYAHYVLLVGVATRKATNVATGERSTTTGAAAPPSKQHASHEDATVLIGLQGHSPVPLLLPIAKLRASNERLVSPAKKPNDVVLSEHGFRLRRRVLLLS